MSYNYYSGGGGAAAVFFTLVWIAFAVVTIVGLWKTLGKAGLPGWAAIIPFYNEYNVVKMSNRPLYFFWLILACSLLAWIPLLGFILIIGAFVLWVFIALDIAANFGQGTGFAILLIIFPWIMFLVLGFGSATFNRIAAPGSAGFGSPPMPAGGTYAASPPPPAGGYAVPPAPPAPPATPVTPVTPAQTAAPAAPVTPPVTPTEAAPAVPVTPPVTTETPGTAAAVTEVPAAPEVPDVPPVEPPASSPPPPPPLS